MQLRQRSSSKLFANSAFFFILEISWRENGVVQSSMQSNDVASTLVRRHFDVICLLGKVIKIEVAK